MLRGRAIAASPGIAIGHVQKLVHGRLLIPEYHIANRAIEREVQRLNAAIEASLQELDEERPHLSTMQSQEPLHILEAQRMLLLDPELAESAKGLIRQQKINAEWALRIQMDRIEAVFDRIEDAYLRSKKLDIEHVGQRILNHLMGNHAPYAVVHCDDPMILVCRDFSPLEAVRLWRQGLAGFVTEQGGVNAHTIIIARGVGMPALMGAKGLMELAEDGDALIIDGERGQWILNPTPKELGKYRDYAATMEQARTGLKAFAGKPSRSADGHPLKLMANLEFIEELALAKEIGIDGIGLYRTEFLFTNQDSLPGEEEQYEHYVEVIRTMQGMPVTFRLMDVGGDKPVLFKQLAGRGWGGANPSMGLRGIRLLLDQPKVLRTQIRAMLRASREGQVQILMPMVTRTEEVLAVREMLSECEQDLGLDCPTKLGTMIEVPAAALIADELAGISDFFSVGTNDLIQYTLAADRGDEGVADLYNPNHKAVLRLLEHTVAAAKRAGIPVMMCGEMAGDPHWTEMLLNMGFDALSMSLSRILPIRKHLAELVYRPMPLH